MAIAGALVVPFDQKCIQALKQRLVDLPSVEVEAIGPQGIAIVLEEDNPGQLKNISEKIKAWDEVIDFQLAYLNWEDIKEDKEL